MRDSLLSLKSLQQRFYRVFAVKELDFSSHQLRHVFVFLREFGPAAFPLRLRCAAIVNDSERYVAMFPLNKLEICFYIVAIVAQTIAAL